MRRRRTIPFSCLRPRNPASVRPRRRPAMNSCSSSSVP
jgi:hypothetical protein